MLAMVVAASTYINVLAYQTEGWAFFHEFQKVRVPFSDYGATRALMTRPDLLIDHGYTTNDIALLGSWFFVDPEISRPERLQALLDDLGPLILQSNTLDNAWRAAEGFFHPSLLPMLVAAVILLALSPSWRGFAVWILAISALVLIGVIGRPAVTRIYFPIVALLLVTPLIVRGGGVDLQPWRKAVSALVILLAAGWNGWTVSDDLLRRSSASAAIRQYVATMSEGTIAAWGSGFPYQDAVPVLGAADRSARINIFSLGSTTFAPNTIARQHSLEGKGFLQKLYSDEGVRLISGDDYMKLLETYCHERGRVMLANDTNAGEAILIIAVRCTLENSS